MRPFPRPRFGAHGYGISRQPRLGAHGEDLFRQSRLDSKAVTPFRGPPTPPTPTEFGREGGKPYPLTTFGREGGKPLIPTGLGRVGGETFSQNLFWWRILEILSSYRVWRRWNGISFIPRFRAIGADLFRQPRLGANAAQPFTPPSLRANGGSYQSTEIGGEWRRHFQQTEFGRKGGGNRRFRVRRRRNLFFLRRLGAYGKDLSSKPRLGAKAGTPFPHSRVCARMRGRVFPIPLLVAKKKTFSANRAWARMAKTFPANRVWAQMRRKIPPPPPRLGAKAVAPFSFYRNCACAGAAFSAYRA